ncbi:hypothetical protein [Calidifontibacillus erzurumensis]|uniref:Uncharacterized protein n=1 Tax=Calidifontibacillus erzurumensis TaxID=2741433 RepID=A0A8J8GGK6_9BACI|nr:hypothetical protein [Calidifontibacillus erzurumensis]NSL51935.1 hypothetical protein [Calidifontibacillus erzurumensis]
MKKIVSTDILLGNSIHGHIHDVIGRVQTGEPLPTENELVERIRTDLNSAYIDSTQRRQQWYEQPSKYSMLHEIYYDGQLSKEKIHDIQERTSLCVNHFLSSQTFEEIIHNPDLKIVDSERFRVMEVDGVNIFAVLDLVYQRINPRILDNYTLNLSFSQFFIFCFLPLFR